MGYTPRVKWQTKTIMFIESKGTTAKKLAAKLGINYVSFKKMLKDESGSPLVESAIKLAHELGTTVEELFDPESGWPPDGIWVRHTMADLRQRIAESGVDPDWVFDCFDPANHRAFLEYVAGVRASQADANKPGVRQADTGKTEAPVAEATKIVQREQRARKVTRKKRRKA